MILYGLCPHHRQHKWIQSSFSIYGRRCDHKGQYEMRVYRRSRIPLSDYFACLDLISFSMSSALLALSPAGAAVAGTASGCGAGAGSLTAGAGSDAGAVVVAGASATGVCGLL